VGAFVAVGVGATAAGEPPDDVEELVVVDAEGDGVLPAVGEPEAPTDADGDAGEVGDAVGDEDGVGEALGDGLAVGCAWSTGPMLGIS
jgi:hypothetical protein